MLRVALTGSIGMGKSTTADMFRAENIPVHDADATVHKLYENEAVPLIEAAFPGTTKDNKVDRDALGKIVLSDNAAMKKLEAIVHPLVYQKEQEFLADAEQAGADFVILDIPLLYENGGEKRVDLVIVVTASADEQRKRVLARPGMTEEKFESILARQVPDQEKRAKADYLINTNDGIEEATKQVSSIIAEIRKNL